MNPIQNQTPIHGELAYVYAFKARAKRHHCLGYGTFSVEMDRVLALRRRYSHEVTPVTLVPVYVKTVARAVERNPAANSILFRKPFGYRIVRFERVDVNVPIARELDGRMVTFIATIRDAPSKSLAEIQKELSEYQHCPPEESFAIRRFRKLARMPLWLAQLVHGRMTWSPEFYVRNVGTCGLTLAEGDWFEHGFPIAPTSAVFGIGGLRREPVVRGEEIAIGRMLKGTLMVDNYVVSGLAGSQLVRDFRELLETGAVIEEELPGGDTVRGPSQAPIEVAAAS